MKSRFGLPAFSAAWRSIKADSDNFHELRRLEEEVSRVYPAGWEKR